jgi:putative ABC transport system substrate-binding protein
MSRREFIALLGAGLAAAFSPTAIAQPAGRKWRIGYLFPGSSDSSAMSVFDGWKRVLREKGYAEGQNLTLDWRFAENDFSRLPQLAQDMVAANPDVIVAVTTPAVRAAHAATTTIPIVMGNIGDPIGSGFVKSLARPGGRITGTANMTVDYMPKTIELLREMLPAARRVAVLMSDNPVHPLMYRAIDTIAVTTGIELLPVIARTVADLDDAFATIAGQKADAVIVLTDAVRLRIVALAATAKVPVIYQISSFVDAGGLISYGANAGALVAQTAIYVDKILKGADPAELPVEQPTRFELKINLRTARALSLSIPPTLLARADEVIE